MKEVPFRFLQFAPPTSAPFDQADCWWPTVVGNFFRPIVSDPAIEAFVFLNHRPKDIELQFASKDYARIEKEITKLATHFGIQQTKFPADGHTVGNHAYRGTRWISTPRDQISDDARRRSELVLRFLHAGCALFLDSLVPDGPRWRKEDNTDQENPRHNLFESQLHLISNFSETDFNVVLAQTGQGVSAMTEWMHRPGWQPLAHIGVCHL